jgi:hypothetical protein
MAKGWTKKLSELAVKIGEETHQMNADGEMLSKDEVLVRQIWDEALGYEERTVDDKGKEKIVKHKPQKWAKELLWNRREGGIQAALAETGEGITAAEQVRELSKARMNKVTEDLDAK